MSLMWHIGMIIKFLLNQLKFFLKIKTDFQRRKERFLSDVFVTTSHAHTYNTFYSILKSLNSFLQSGLAHSLWRLPGGGWQGTLERVRVFSGPAWVWEARSVLRRENRADSPSGVVTFPKTSEHAGICCSSGAFPCIQTSVISGLFHVRGTSVVMVGNGPVALRCHARLSKPTRPALPLRVYQTSGGWGGFGETL